ncbi:MAG: PL29 family lyase N-terminal domain-containing protein [Rikenellaceae bacterium]|nr:PL29 family lyase N-terminal domain-containing protein [Rikenellaceae bacterium]
MKSFFQKFAVVALLLTAVMGWSCEECDHVPYDDTEIKEQIADLYNKLATLEAKLSAEMEALNAMLSGKALVTAVTTDTAGNTVIELSNGKKITVYAEYQPDALPTNLVYVIEQDGEMVWATYGSNGQLTPILDSEGQPIPVIAEIPQIQFRMTDDVIEISIDGGTTWTATGVSAEALQEALKNHDCTLIKSVEEKDGVVVITLQTGETFEVNMAVEADFGIKSGKVYFAADETKYFELETTGITDVAVMDTPMGWTAAVNALGDMLRVTAPAEGVDAQIEGYVRLLGISEEGKSYVGKLFVSCSSEVLTLTTDFENNIIVNNQGNNNYVLGMMPAAEFDAEAVAEELQNGGAALKYKNIGYEWYSTKTIPAADLYQELYEAEMPIESYVIWLATYTEAWDNEVGDYVLTFNVLSGADLIYTDYAPLYVTVTGTTTFNSVNVDVHVDGCPSFILNVMQGDNNPMEMNFSYWKQGHSWASIGDELQTPYEYTGSITGLPNDGLELLPGRTYKIGILPLMEGKEKAEYVLEDIRYFTFTTAPLVAGGETTVTNTVETLEYTEMQFTLKTSENTSMIYYAALKEEAAAALTSDEQIAEYLLTNGYIVRAENGVATANFFIEALQPGEKRVIIAFAADAEGKYGTIYKETFQTKTLDFTDAVTLNLEKLAAADAMAAATSAQFKFTAEGATTYFYRNFRASQWANYTLDEVATELALHESYNVKEEPSGEIDLTGLTTGETYYFAVLAQVTVDGETTFTQMKYIEYTPTFTGTVIPATDPKWEASKPTVTATAAEAGFKPITYTVIPAANTKVSGGLYANSTMSSKTAAEQIVYICTGSSILTPIKDVTEETTKTASKNTTTTSVFVTWTDADGNYYEPMKVVAEIVAAE